MLRWVREKNAHGHPSPLRFFSRTRLAPYPLGAFSDPLIAPRGASGFTLLEILVVIVIVGIVASFATLALRGADWKAIAEEEATRLAALLKLASDQAVLETRQLALSIDREGYLFLVFDEAVDTPYWRPLEQDDLLGGVRSPHEGLELRLVESEELGAATASSREGDDYAPHVLLLSSGEMTPFTIDIVATDTDDHCALSGTLDGEIAVCTQAVAGK